MAAIPVLDHDSVLGAVSPADAVDAVREAFLAHHRGDWTMPSKVYLQSPPHGDFRAMPALGDGVALLKWISSFPGNPAKGLPAVQGVVLLSDAETSAPLMLLDARAVTALRTGAVAAAALAPDARTVGIIGSGLHGAWAARCLAAVGYGPGVAADPRPEAAAAIVHEHGGAWRTGGRRDALAADVVCTVTPGTAEVIGLDDLRPGLLLAMLGADGPGKREASVDAVAACGLVCDEWAQASHGGELTAAVQAGRVTRDDVVDLGAILAGEVPAPPTARTPTMFDSTGLAVQDLAIALAALRAWRAGRIDAGHARF